jgi:hypothetical protein
MEQMQCNNIYNFQWTKRTNYMNKTENGFIWTIMQR